MTAKQKPKFKVGQMVRETKGERRIGKILETHIDPPLGRCYTVAFGPKKGFMKAEESYWEDPFKKQEKKP